MNTVRKHRFGLYVLYKKLDGSHVRKHHRVEKVIMGISQVQLTCPYFE